MRTFDELYLRHHASMRQVRPRPRHDSPLAGCRLSARQRPLSGTSLPAARFAPPALPGFITTIMRSDFSTDISVTLFPPSRLLLFGDPRRSPGLRLNNVPPLPPSLPSQLDRISGVTLQHTLTQPRSAYRRFTVRSVLRSSSGFHPTPPHGDAVAFRSRLPPVGPAKDSHLHAHLLSSSHAQRTPRQETCHG